MAFGKTIRIYLADGTATGIRHAELVNWTGQAMVCPRSKVANLKHWDEANRPGVYILLGEDPESTRDAAYIGEAENVYDRLKNHIRSKDFWDRVILFSSKDENLTKSHVKYLESRIVQIAKSADRVVVRNKTAPPPPNLPRSERDAMEEFLEPVKLLLGSLGTPMLKPVIERSSGNDVSEPGGAEVVFFTVDKTGVDASGVSTDEGFVVLGGSVAARECGKSLSRGYLEQREELIAEGAMKLENDQYVSVRDILFSSPSAAAAVFAGTTRNGMWDWKNQEGVPLKRLEDALVASDDSAELADAIE